MAQVTLPQTSSYEKAAAKISYEQVSRLDRSISKMPDVRAPSRRSFDQASRHHA
jgi:hypothetical protein